MTVAIGFSGDSHEAVRLYLVAVDGPRGVYRLACDTACGWSTWAAGSPVAERRGIIVTCDGCRSRMTRTHRRAA